MRPLRLIVLGLVLVAAPRTALASPLFPAQIVSQLGLLDAGCDGGLAPGCQCMLCHTTCPGQGNTYGQYFGEYVDQQGVTTVSGLSSLLTSMEMTSYAVNPNAMTCGAIDVLRACQDPNNADAGCTPLPRKHADAGDAAVVAPEDAGFTRPTHGVTIAPPTYGCLGQIAPSGASMEVPCGVGCLGVAAAVIRRRRRGASPKKR